MRLTKLHLCMIALLATTGSVLSKFSYTDGDNYYSIENKLLIEGFGGENLTLLNDDNRTTDCESLDRFIIPGGHTWDLKMGYQYGNETYDRDITSVGIGLRNKGIWGSPESIAKTKDSSIKLLDVKTGGHNHNIPIHATIVRELWLSMELAQLTGLSMDTSHRFSLGLFPFQLGRGIAYGPAYQVIPDLIGYKPIDSVQQFAPGFLFSGDITDCLGYDAYGAILENNSSNFNEVNTKNRGQEIGKLQDPARGSGVINYVVAGRINWTPIHDDCAYMYLETYGMYNRQDEQKVEFVGDATLDLGTVGLAGEFQAGDFECGFDTAFNVGEQNVKAWDRNQIKFENYTIDDADPDVADVDLAGFPRAINGEVTNTNIDKKASYQSGSSTQDAINRQAQFETQDSNVARLNGQTFTATDGTPLKNSGKRFRNAYTNELHGSMFVFDASYRFHECAKFAVSGGFATGDENPNRDLNEFRESEQDGVFGGFLGLQEIYSGKRVRSYMVMSGVGKFPRVASFPDGERGDQFGNRFADRVSRFTDLVFVGSAFWIDTDTASNWSINPNVISFWQHNTTKIFDTNINARGAKNADDHLGVEANIAIEGYPIKNLKFFAIGGFFEPGDHFDDIKGRPINKDQQEFLDRQDSTGFETDPQPLVGNDTAWFINAGLEYRF